MAQTGATPQVTPPLAEAASPPRPSLVLRAVASVILSRWVRRRINHRAVRLSLAAVARQVGRTEIASELERESES